MNRHTMVKAPDPAARHSLRQQMRHRRRTLSAGQQRRAANRVARHLSRHTLFQRSRHIAFYLPNDGELDPRPLMERAWQQGKFCYLPVLHPLHPRQLWFVRYTPGTRLRPNRFGIPEPDLRRHPRCSARRLDLVLMPLVAFDRQGGRLGMGGGFYDTTFAFRHQTRLGPKLVGLAHAFQEVPALPLALWDVPLAAIATDDTLIHCR